MLMRPFLLRKHVPAVIRAQLVRAVLVLIAIYGCELYGMSSARLHPLQRVIDRAIRDVLYSSKCCRKAAYKELRILSMALKARTIAKWSSSRTTIGSLLRSPFKDRSATWMTGTQRWLKTLLHTTDAREAVFAVVTVMTTRLEATDRRRICQFTRVHNLGCAIPLCEPVLDHQ
ncbi:putative transposable element protein [Pseudoloma neurophilia]|uniref:Putative transposable element protein n=1 Tax=Pseudoloma neurophilia TaxID=146866 RepID=A0A0R0LUG2_9MICR|nr:putative transposable element protein [Pseudoloma neurophilia]